MMGTLVIGIGNADRCDDAAGIEVARRLRGRPLPDALVKECSGYASCLLESWLGRRSVILIDAASGGGRAGRVRRFEAHREPLPASLLHASTHSWGVAEAVELARSLGQLPPRVVVYAIEGKRFGPGRELSPAVQRAILRVEKQVLKELGQASESYGTAVNPPAAPAARPGTSPGA